MSERLKRYQKGQWAEWICAAFLMVKFYRPLKWRYKTSVGEIDLIVLRGQSLVFVEVKARETRAKGLEAITSKGVKRITRAAEYFIMKHPKYQKFDMRFDVMVVTPKSLPYHVKNAW